MTNENNQTNENGRIDKSALILVYDKIKVFEDFFFEMEKKTHNEKAQKLIIEIQDNIEDVGTQIYYLLQEVA